MHLVEGVDRRAGPSGLVVGEAKEQQRNLIAGNRRMDAAGQRFNICQIVVRVEIAEHFNERTDHD